MGRHSVFETKLPVICWLCLAELGVTLCILHPLLLLQKIFFWTTFNRFVGHPPVFEGQDDDWDGDDYDHMMEIKKTWLVWYLNNLMRLTIRVGFKCHIILAWTYVSSVIKGHFVFPNCQFRKRWFGPQQAKSKGWLWSLRPFLSLSFTAKCHRYQSVKWENIALAVQKLVNICMVKTYILSVDWHLPFYFLKYPGNLDKVQKNSSFYSGDRP